MFASKDIFLKSSGGYQISRSVRLRSSASAYLNRTPTTAGNRKTWTWSGWVKRGKQGAINYIFGAPSSYTTAFRFNSANTFFFTGASSTHFIFETTAVYRDSSAWYHVVIALDTTQATSTNRVKIYINGNQVTAFAAATYPSLNLDGEINNAHYHGIGTPSSSDTHDGYLTEVNFIDGQALTPSSFGETNSVTGVWQPKKYTGTYGTNGFYLNFSDNSGVTATTIGKDYSGNGNNWTPNNISITAGVTYDSMLDVPTLYADGGNGRGNYCTLNPLAVTAANSTITNGNLQVVTPNVGGNAYATMGIPTSGKWYFEVTPTSGTGNAYIGVSAYTVASTYLWQNSNHVFYTGGGNKSVDGSSSSYGASYTDNDVIGVACDSDAGTITFYKNNASQGSISHTMVDMFPALTDGASASGVTYQTNFGQRPFTYTPPTGFVALNTQNLPDATIKKGNLFFNTATWSSDIVNPTIGQKSIALGFQPDLVWSKNRDNAESHYWMDSVRGNNAGNKWLRSNATAAEGADALGSTTASYVFNSTGFDIVDTNSASGEVYFNNGSASTPRTYVGWAWNAGGSTVTNTSGTISAQVRANPTAGFSVVTYTGNGLTNQSVGHGLNATPGMVIIKQRDGTANWLVHHQSQPTGYTVYLNLTNAQDSGTSQWGTSAQTSSLFYVGYTAGATGSNVNASTYVAYCFAAVAGYSAFGSYTGNGSTDGPFVYTGFRPRWVLVKRTDTIGNWQLLDTSRSTYNISNANLYPNLSNAEVNGGNEDMDILSNGFKPRNASASFNVNGGTYIYACFAEVPFKVANAR